MIRTIVVTMMVFLIGGVLYLAAHRHHRRSHVAIADDDVITQADQASTSSASSGPRTSKTMVPTTSGPAGKRRASSITEDRKLHLDIAKMLLKNAAFRAANPQLTLEKFLAGEVDLKDIKLPKGLKLSYEFDPRCKGAQNGVVAGAPLTARETKNLNNDAPAFITRAISDDNETVASLSDHLSTDGCVRGLSFDAGTQVTDKANSQSATLTTDPQQKQIADQAVKDAVAADGQARMAVIGLRADFKATDRSLLGKDSTGNYYHTPGIYTLGDGSDPNAGSTNVTRRPFVVHPDSTGTYSDSEVSNAITHAADRGYKVINVTLAGFNTSDYQAAVDYAKQHGSTVVFQVPVPPPPKGAGKSGTKSTTTTP